MLPWYGILGIFMMVYAEASFFLPWLQVDPFYHWTFPIIWFGYIFLIDAVIFSKKNHSLIRNHFPKFLAMLLISAPLWQVFEFINLFIQNWHYIGIEYFGKYADIFGWLSFSTVIPAFFETFQLLAFHTKRKSEKKRNLSRTTLNILILLGIILFFLPLFFPKYFFPLVWLSLFLIIDPINAKNNQPSILSHWKNGNRKYVYKMLLTGIILGFLWEFWNFWSPVKWVYTIPYVGFLKIFEMPLLGYLGYFPFALEIYAVYYFIKGLLKK